MIAEIELKAEQDIERITCGEAGCGGCTCMHYRPFGAVKYFIDGQRASRAAYDEECARWGQIPGAVEEASD